MNYRKFKDELIQKLEEEIGMKVINQKITKNNNVILDSVTIQKEDDSVAPTIYLEPFYEDYQEGRMMDKIVAEIIRIDKENRNSDFKEVVSNFSCYDRIKHNISYKLVNYEKNAEILQKIPHRKFLDLAIVYQVVGFDKQKGMATILINQFHADTWRVTEEILYEAAKKNTPRLLPYTIKDMQSILSEMEVLTGFSDENMHELVGEYVPMYVLTNTYKNYGAICILYDDVLEEIKKVVGEDFYILPSSVHEVIIVKDDRENGVEYLKQMVKDVNLTVISEEEFLADSVYVYRGQSDLELL